MADQSTLGLTPGLYRHIVEMANEGVLVLDGDARITFANRQLGELLGCAPDALAGRHLVEWLFPEDVPAVLSEFSGRLAGRPGRFESRFRRNDGQAVWTIVSVAPLTAVAGGVAGTFALVTDITDRHLAEQVLADSDARNRRLVELLPESLVLSQSGQIVYANPAAVRMLGARSETALVGRPALDLVHPRDRKRMTELARELAISSVAGPVATVTMLRLDGSEFDAEVTAIPFEYQGRPAAQLIAVDVTERKRAESELRRSEEKFRTVFDSAGDALFIHDIEGRLLEVNRTACESLGYSHEELLNVLPLDLEAADARVSEAERPGTDVRIFETAYSKRDGQPLPVEVSSRPVSFDGQPGVLTVARDITERRRAEAALRASEAELRRLTEAVHQAGEAIVVTAVDGTIEYVNPAFEQASGYRREEVLGQTSRVLKSGHHPAEFYETLWQTIGSGRTWTGRLVNRRKDGAIYTEDTTITPVMDGHGRIERFVAVKRDVSKDLVLEAHIKETQRLEALGRLASGVAHDLNNLLQPILGYAELGLAEAEGSEEQQAGLNEIMKAGERSRDLIQQLLAFGRKQTLDVTPADIGDVLRGMTALVRRAIREDIEVSFDIPSEPCRAVVDRGQFERAIVTLAMSAQDALPGSGAIRIDVRSVAFAAGAPTAHPGVPPGHYAMVTVRDNGLPLTPEARHRMFEPFFHARGSDGSGLGLAMVYGVVRQHSGYAEVESEAGLGTAVHLYFPASGGASVPVDRAESFASRGTETIVLAEDDATVRRITARILERLGYAVLASDSGRGALEVDARHAGPVHLLLSDVVMPDMNGLELFHQLEARHPGLKVVFMSGYPQRVVVEHGITLDDVPLLSKPFRVPELTALVRKVLDSRS
jgi:two-component system, cell cycle sensor histidine kinase and response regulator CckA